MNPDKLTSMDVSDLSFDVKNPRLLGLDVSENPTEEEIIKTLWDTMDVKELVLSIAASGFFPHEPLIVSEEEGKKVVIEGNRRLAAVKILLNRGIVKNISADLPKIGTAEREALEELPIISKSREETWRYLGFKHVNGPAKWSSYAKSRYIAEVHRDFKVPLVDIAKQIGDTHKTVQRLYRGLMVIEQAEEMKVFDLNDRWRAHFSFSHLYTGIDYEGISAFIGLKSENEELRKPIPAGKKDALRELCLWLYGSKKNKKPPVVETQNPHLRQLDAILKSNEALAALRSGASITVAHELSRPASTVFEEALFASKRKLEEAIRKITEGYDGSKKLLEVAETIIELAFDLHDAMDRKTRSPGKERGRPSERDDV